MSLEKRHETLCNVIKEAIEKIGAVVDANLSGASEATFLEKLTALHHFKMEMKDALCKDQISESMETNLQCAQAAVNTAKATRWEYFKAKNFGIPLLTNDGIGHEVVLNEFRGKLYLIDYKEKPRRDDNAGA